MKKYLITLLISASSLGGFSQTCEERETKLLEAFGGFSAGMLYNTYGLIGSISDGFTHDAYDAVVLSDLLDAQKKVADNLANLVQSLKTGNYLTDKNDQVYADSMITILRGLKQQAQLLKNYADKNNRQNQDAYETQRRQNWSAISKLMGIKE